LREVQKEGGEEANYESLRGQVREEGVEAVLSGIANDRAFVGKGI
jgi:hypothetical protein